MPQWDPENTEVENKNRTKRAYKPDPRVTIYLIGQPRGIPEKYKARN